MCFGTGCHGRVSHISPILRRLLKAAQPEWSVSCPVTFSLWPWTHHPALFSPLGGVSVPWWEKVSGRAAATQSRLIVWGERRLTCWTAAAWFKLLLFIHLRVFFSETLRVGPQDDGHSFTKRHQRQRRRQQLFQKGEFSPSTHKHSRHVYCNSQRTFYSWNISSLSACGVWHVMAGLE